MLFNLQENNAQHCSSRGTQHNNAQGLDSDREENVSTNATVESASSLFCHLPFSLQTEGKSKNHHLSVHITSLLLSSQMKAQCVGPFNKGQ